MQREVEEQKEAAAAEQRDLLAQQKVAREAAAAEEEWQLLAMGLSGLKLTIPAPASIVQMTSGLSTQSKWKRKVTEEEPSTSQYVLFIHFFHSLLTFSGGQSFRHATRAQSLVLLV
jgi:hypothetical protein